MLWPLSFLLQALLHIRRRHAADLLEDLRNLLALAGPRVDVLVGGAPTYIRASEAEIRYPDGVPGALRKRD